MNSGLRPVSAYGLVTMVCVALVLTPSLGGGVKSRGTVVRSVCGLWVGKYVNCYVWCGVSIIMALVVRLNYAWCWLLMNT